MEESQEEIIYVCIFKPHLEFHVYVHKTELCMYLMPVK